MRYVVTWLLVGAMVLASGAQWVVAETGAFHDAAHLQCNKCHAIHYSEDGTAPTEANGFGTDADTDGSSLRLLLKENTTDLCLSCHDDADVAPDVFGAGVETPGGDFGQSGATADRAKGHNPGGTSGNESTNIKIDTDLGLTPPGGTALAEWTCISCHDGHGDTDRAFTFRNLLKNPGGLLADALDSTVFVAADGEESDIWDGSGANVAQSPTNHNVYRTGTTIGKEVGFGTWCATCHGDFHHGAEPNAPEDVAWTHHPTAMALPNEYIANYGTTSSYLYPLETSNSSAGTTAEWTLAQGKEGVTCLSCHRAHASDYANATRWDNGAASGVGTGCNKCHAKGT